MPRYLYKGSYTQEGIKGLMAGGGGTARKQAVEELTASLGGSLEGFYYAFGSDDVYVIVDLPDHASATAVALTVAASGAFHGETVVLLDPEDIDEAVTRTPRYRPPGS
ncbi:MAG TPA: GYD domain-containing protein [Longimicrobiales bacterium]|nr:GYD domain-containing protein [Longimicrobiales bacterium]